jgi:hypothetical protein
VLALGIGDEPVNSHLKLLAQIGANEQLKFPPMDVPQDTHVTGIPLVRISRIPCLQAENKLGWYEGTPIKF